MGEEGKGGGQERKERDSGRRDYQLKREGGHEEEGRNNKLSDKICGSSASSPPPSQLLEVLLVLDDQLKGHFFQGAFTDCHKTMLLQKEIITLMASVPHASCIISFNPPTL